MPLFSQSQRKLSADVESSASLLLEASKVNTVLVVPLPGETLNAAVGTVLQVPILTAAEKGEVCPAG